jgi:hypothetical protein
VIRPPPPLPSPVSNSSLFLSLREVELTGGRGGRGGRGPESDDREKAWPSINHSILSNETLLGPHAARVSTEFRRHGIPSVFFTSVYSVFRTELAKIPAEFRRIPCGIIT